MSDGLSWLRLYSDMIFDPKIGTLGHEEFRTWIELLCTAGKHSRDGNTGLTVDGLNWLLRRNVTVTVTKLIERKLIYLNDGQQVVVTNFEKRNPQSDSSKYRVRKYRKNKEKLKCNGDVTLQKRHSNALEERRVDKIREEKNIDIEDINNNLSVIKTQSTYKAISAGLETATEKINEVEKTKRRRKAIAVSPPETPPDDTVISLPLSNGGPYHVTETLIEQQRWEKNYPGVNVLQELRKMESWLKANPTRGKTNRGILRFVNNWLSRQQDRPNNIVQFNNNGRLSYAQQSADALDEILYGG